MSGLGVTNKKELRVKTNLTNAWMNQTTVEITVRNVKLSEYESIIWPSRSTCEISEFASDCFGVEESEAVIAQAASPRKSTAEENAPDLTAPCSSAVS